MAKTFYIVGNSVQVQYAYLNQAKAPVDVSSATSVVLYIYLPDGTTVTVPGLYSATADKNLVTATLLPNTILNSNLPLESNVVRFKFLTTLASGEGIWSPPKEQLWYRNGQAEQNI